MKKRENMPNVEYDRRNLRRNEEVLFTFKPERRSYMIRNFFTAGGIPFPVVVLWAVIDFGVLIGAPLGTGEYWLWAILVPFIGVHGAPIWIWLYGVIKGKKDYDVCGHIITSERILSRSSRKDPFKELKLENVTSLTMLASKNKSSSLHIEAIGLKSSLTLYSLRRTDVETAIDIFHHLKDKEAVSALNQKFKPKCDHCGGRVENGRCLYCGSWGDFKKEYSNIANYTAVDTKRKK